MRRTFALLLGLALLVATPGLAAADPYQRPARNQQAVDFVINRALSQRGVPFSYGGGDANGPTLGTGSSGDDLATEQRSNIPGTDPGFGFFGAAPSATILAPAPAPAPKVVGFDASGLVVYAFAGAGIKLPRSSGEQYKATQKVAPSQALPGDLIFYGPDGAQSVALFLGNAQMLETSSESGVTVSPVRTNNMTPYLGRVIA
ncbi:MAG: NlpC/P60 family peptidoglycan-binding protein RipD [Mycobacterium sp.]